MTSFSASIPPLFRRFSKQAKRAEAMCLVRGGRPRFERTSITHRPPPRIVCSLPALSFCLSVSTRETNMAGQNGRPSFEPSRNAVTIVGESLMHRANRWRKLQSDVPNKYRWPRFTHDLLTIYSRFTRDLLTIHSRSRLSRSCL